MAEVAKPDLCATCRFFADDFAPNAAIEAPEGFGECRRRAPVGPWSYGQVEIGDGVQRQISTVLSAFPLVSQSDWCGEYIATKDTTNG